MSDKEHDGKILRRLLRSARNRRPFFQDFLAGVAPQAERRVRAVNSVLLELGPATRRCAANPEPRWHCVLATIFGAIPAVARQGRGPRRWRHQISLLLGAHETSGRANQLEWGGRYAPVAHPVLQMLSGAERVTPTATVMTSSTWSHRGPAPFDQLAMATSPKTGTNTWRPDLLRPLMWPPSTTTAVRYSRAVAQCGDLGRQWRVPFETCFFLAGSGSSDRGKVKVE